MMAYYRRGWMRLQPITTALTTFPAVSILIAARNEADRIRPTLEALQSLAYRGPLEIIIVDDHSEDNTLSILHHASPDQIVVLQNDGFGKRSALQTGLQSAKGDIILLTDADCIPGPNWIITMITPFIDQNIHWVSGPVAARADANLISRYDSLEWQGLLALTGSGFAHRQPVLAQGANIAFRRSSYDLVSTMSTLPNRASGDDVFLLSAFHQAYPDGCTFQSDPAALVHTLAPDFWSDLIRQRTRWTSKSGSLHPLYGWGPMALVFFMSLLFLSIPVLWYYSTGPWKWLWTIPACCKIFADYLLLSCGWRMTGARPDPTTYLFAILAHPVLVIIAGLVGPLRSHYLWKGRIVR